MSDIVTDEELVALAKRGSQEAMVELFQRHRGVVIGYVLRMTGDRDLADEVFAATFVTFYESLARYQSKGNLVAYLLTIARSRLSDEYRARARLGRAIDDLPRSSSVATDPIDQAPEAWETLASSELGRLAHGALMNLSETLREVVVLRLYEGLDYRTIATATGVSEATARSRMRYGLEQLRKSLGISF